MSPEQFIYPNWPAPSRVKAACTTRQGGVSTEHYASFNLAEHVGDDPHAVQTNRELLNKALALPSKPIWLTQTHSNIIVPAENSNMNIIADASYTFTPHQVCVVMTADCLPILLCDKEGTCVAAIHAGWRGLANNIIEKTLTHLPVTSSTLMAWLGPAISQSVYEVGAEVKEIFLSQNTQTASAFIAQDNEKYLANLYEIAKQQLNALGVMQIYGGEYCTFQTPDQFFSARRDRTTGRMAALIWLEK